MPMLTVGDALGIDRTLFLRLAEKCMSVVLLVSLFFAFVALQIGLLIAFKLAALLFVIALGVVAGFVYQSAQRFRKAFDTPLPPPRVHAGKVHEQMKRERERIAIDTRISGSPVIDAELHQVIDLLLRDYVAVWYNSISRDNTALQQCKRLLSQIIAHIGIRCKSVDWHDLITKTLVDIFVKHVRLYRRASELLENDLRQQQRSLLNMDPAERIEMLEHKFFQLEKDFGGICSDSVRETDYLRDVSEAVLYAFLKPNDFDNKLLRFALREIVATCTLQPVANMMSDPDYINQFPACLIDDSLLSFNSILDVIKTSAHQDDLTTILVNINQSIASKAEAESQASRSRKYKTLMESLLFAKTECQNRIAVITGKPLETKPAVETDIPEVRLSSTFVREHSIAVKYLEEFVVGIEKDHILACWLDIFAFDQNTDLKLQQARMVPDDRRKAFHRKIRDTTQREAKEIFFQYISDTAPRRIDLGPRQLEVMSQVHDNIHRQPLKRVFAPVRNQLERHLDSIHDEFLQSDPYFRCIMSLKFDHGDDYLATLPKHKPQLQQQPSSLHAQGVGHQGGGAPTTGMTTSSLSSSRARAREPHSSSVSSAGGSELFATSSEEDSDEEDLDEMDALLDEGDVMDSESPIGHCSTSTVSRTSSGADRRSRQVSTASSERSRTSTTSSAEKQNSSSTGNNNSNGNSLGVERQDSGGGGSDEYDGWWAAELLERESMRVKKKTVMFYRLKVTFISAKTGTTREWYCLRRYSDFHNFHAELKKRFGHLIEVPLTLPRKTYLKTQSEEFLDQRMKHLRAWLKLIMSHSVLEKPGVKKFVAKFLNEDKYVRTSHSLKSKVFGLGHKPMEEDNDDAEAKETAAAMKNFETNASVPFRILLSLLDVVFELNSNPWLRRRVMSVLQGLIKATLGGSINRKVRAAIDHFTSPEQVSTWVKQYRMAMWPNGILAPAFPERSLDCQRDTRIEAKAKLLGILPDELKRIIGHDTAKRGMLGLFDMLQHPRLNRRLLFVVFEALLVRLLPPPASKINELLQRQHDI